MYCKVLQANLTGQLAECVVKFLTREAVAHLRVLRPQACHILRHVPVAQDAVSHQLGQLSKLLLTEAEPGHFGDTHTQCAGGGEALFVGSGLVVDNDIVLPRITPLTTPLPAPITRASPVWPPS